MYKLFDAHAHAFPDAIAKRAVDNLAKKANIPYYHNGTFPGLLQYEKDGGASGFLLLPIATKPGSEHAVNQWAAAQTGGGAVAFGSVHPESENIAQSLDEIVALGLKGVKLHPEYQVFFVDEDRMLPIYQAIFERGLPVCFHAGVDIGFPPPVRGDVRRIANICDRFPQGKIIAAHMGGFAQQELFCEYLAGRKNVWIDTSFAAERMPAHEIVSLARLHGIQRVLFATDTPWASFESAKNAILNAGFTVEEQADIFYGNAQALLNL